MSPAPEAGTPARCDPALTALFTPPHPRAGRYEVCISGDTLDDEAAAGRQRGIQFGPVEAVEALDAFGAAGPYDRSALNRLYRGRRLRVRRGWRRDGDHLESTVLLSPYPDALLQRLNNGTMSIRLVLEP